MARPGMMNNVKFKLLCRRLDLPRPYVRGLLETLWDVAHESGNPVIGSTDSVEAAAEWPGEAGVFFAALRDCRLIDQREDGLWEIHDYWHHAPEYVKGRLRKEEERRRKYESRDCHATVTEKSDEIREVRATPSPSPSPLNTSSCGDEEAATKKGPTPEEFLAVWNAVEGFAPAREMTPKRCRALQARAKESAWSQNWQAAIERAARSTFLRGGGDKGWHADIDFFLRPDTVTKILEGKYDDPPRNGKPAQGDEEPFAEKLARQLAEREREKREWEERKARPVRSIRDIRPPAGGVT